MKKFIVSVISLITMLSVTLSACVTGAPNGSQGGGTSSTQYTGKGYSWYVMNTVGNIVVYDDFTDDENVTKFESFCTRAGELLRSIENSVSATISTSSVYKFNAAAAGEKVEVDNIAFEVLTAAKSVYTLSGGYYNPAVYYSVAAYGFNGARETPPQSVEELPADGDIEKYVELSQKFSGLVLTEENGKFFAVKPQFTVEAGGKELSLKIDLGGVGKGYAADKIDELFSSFGYDKAYFNFGSSSLSFKKFKDGGQYTMSCTDPRGEYDPLTGVRGQFVRIPVSDVRASVSGDYENYFLLDTDGDGKEERFCHVFDPTTGKPVRTGITTAAVVGGSAAEDDALTTAIMAMGVDAAKSFITQKLSDRRVIFTYETAEGSFYYTNMPDGGYTIINDRYAFRGA